MTSKRTARREPARDPVGNQVQPVEPVSAGPAGFRPAHLFLVASLLAAAAAAVAVRGTSPASVVFVCLTVLTAGAAGFALYRTLAPLVEPEALEAPEMVGGRTRAALEREKTLVLRAIKELEFDRAMGKVADADWQEMTSRLRARAIGLIRQLDTGTAVYRDLIEKEVAARAGATSAGAGLRAHPDSAVGAGLRARPGGDRGGPPSGSALVLALALSLAAAASWAQMGQRGAMGTPDAKSMSGIPLSSESVPAGSVSVRLVRQEISNLVVGHPVEFLAGGTVRTVVTDATGHAVLGGVPAGTTVRAAATVDGARVESQSFQVSADHGVAVVLVAPGGAGPAGAGAVPGTVVLGGQSRVVVQLDEERVQAFFLIDLSNGGGAPVRTAAPLVFDLPESARDATLMEGSASSATVAGRRVTVAGPFQPGTTSVQVGFQMPAGGVASFRLGLPAAWPEPVVIVEKVAGMGVASAQLPSRREAADAGRAFILATGPALRAGEALAFEVSGLPSHPAWPRNTALALAGALLVAGAWASRRRGADTAEAAARQATERRRERALDELVALERRRLAGTAGAADAGRRAALMAELERIYGELDTEGRAAAGQGASA